MENFSTQAQDMSGLFLRIPGYTKRPLELNYILSRFHDIHQVYLWWSYCERALLALSIYHTKLLL